MNNEAIKLIEQLAQKLGTTTEYLWSVLLRQAPVAATITLIQVILVIISGVVLYKLHKHFSNNNNKVSYYNASEATGIPMMIGLCVWVILVVGSFLCIESIITGYFNPEFWALDYIFDSLKDKP